MYKIEKKIFSCTHEYKTILYLKDTNINKKKSIIYIIYFAATYVSKTLINVRDNSAM